MKYTLPIIKGQGRGKGIGYPTFNLKIPPDFPLKPGIYACKVWIEDKQYAGALHFGPVPVFSQPTPSLEIFVLDYGAARSAAESAAATGSRNGRIGSLREADVAKEDPIHSITFAPIQYFRPVRNFSSPQALSHQISLDVAQVRQILSSGR